MEFSVLHGSRELGHLFLGDILHIWIPLHDDHQDGTRYLVVFEIREKAQTAGDLQERSQPPTK